jgi:hypothetical protein
MDAPQNEFGGGINRIVGDAEPDVRVPAVRREAGVARIDVFDLIGRSADTVRSMIA